MNGQKRIENIDTIRGFACLLILFAHIISRNPEIGMYVNGCGKIGVWFFLVASGFLSLLPYIDDVNVKPVNSKTMLAFYCKKIVKLYPVYILVLLIGLIVKWLPSVNDVILHIFALEGYGHLWYMPVIVKFYLIFPIVAHIAKRTPANLLAFELLLVAVVLAVLFPYTTYEENSIRLYWYLPVFIMGMILAIVIKLCGDKMNKSYVWDVIALIDVATMFMMTPLARKLIWNIEPSPWLQNKYIYFGIMWSLFIWCIKYGKATDEILKNIRPLRFVGSISYEVYLIHFIIIDVICRYVSNTLMMGFVSFVISIIAGWILNEANKRFVKK